MAGMSLNNQGYPRLLVQLDDGTHREISNCISDMQVRHDPGSFHSQVEYRFTVSLGQAELTAPPSSSAFGYKTGGFTVNLASVEEPVTRDPGRSITPTGDFQGEPELVLEPIYALRVWRVSDDGFLRPRGVASDAWTPGQNLSRHFYSTTAQILYGERAGDGHGFKADCTCGFWAYYTFDGSYIEDFLEDGCRNPNRLGWFNAIMGVVKVTGEVVMGEKGVRAQKAEIVALCAPGYLDRYNPILRAIAGNYQGVPIYFNVDDMITEFPVTAPPIGSNVKVTPSGDIRKRGVHPLVKYPGKTSLIERITK